MITSRRSLLLSLMAAAAGCTSPRTRHDGADQWTETTSFVGWGFQVQMTRGLSVHVFKAAPEFDLYDFIVTVGDRQIAILHVFAGDSPSFQRDFILAPTEEITLNGLPGKARSWTDDDGLPAREILLQLAEETDPPPTYLHLRYRHLPKEHVKYADHIINSVSKVPNCL
jgi:hypothetical protein